MVRVGLEISQGIYFTPAINDLHGIASWLINVRVGILISVAAISKWGGNDLALAASIVLCSTLTASLTGQM